jgi:hypothetical protein
VCPHAAGVRYDPRTAFLLEAPITPTLLRLAVPDARVGDAGFARAHRGLFVGKLGTSALAGGRKPH